MKKKNFVRQILRGALLIASLFPPFEFILTGYTVVPDLREWPEAHILWRARFYCALITS